MEQKDTSKRPTTGMIPRPRIITTLRKPSSPTSQQNTQEKQPNQQQQQPQNHKQSSATSTHHPTSPHPTGRQQHAKGLRMSSRVGGVTRSPTASLASKRAEVRLMETISASSLPHASVSNMHTVKHTDEHEEELDKLKHSLQGERNAHKQLRREMIVQLKQVREDEQHKSILLMKDMKSRLHFEKVRELESQKDSLNRKFETELQKINKVREADLRKLQADIHKLQDELQLTAAASNTASAASVHSNTMRGLSVTARPPFEHERTKLQKEIKDLLTSRKARDDEMALLRDREKQVASQLKKERDEHLQQMTRLKKDSDLEIRRLFDELKSKDRQLLSNDPTVRRRDEHPHGGSLDTGTGGHTSPSPSHSNTGSLPRRKPQRANSSSSLHEEQSQSGWTPKSSELSSKVRAREDKLHTLEEERTKLKTKVKELENKTRALTERNDRNKKLFDKNMELNSNNRHLEETVAKLTKQNECLKTEMSKNSPGSSPRNGRHSHGDSGYEETHDDLIRELQIVRRQNVENDKTCASLKLACAEKDRRIELILHRKRKQRVSKAQNKKKAVRFQVPLAAGIKETYFGYDEADTQSIDSELSLSVSSSGDFIDDEEVFEEFTREEFQQNYQRLVKEHMELENSYRLLQATHGSSFVDPQREEKMRTQLQSDLLDAQCRIEELEKLLRSEGKDTGWIQEKEQMNKYLRETKEKLKKVEEAKAAAEYHLREVQEQNEDLEFRTLELEEQAEKLQCQDKRSENSSIAIIGEFSAITNDSHLQIYMEEKGTQEISIASLRENLEAIKGNHGTSLSTEEQLQLSQAVLLVDAAEKRLKEQSNKVEALKTRISQLEEEKAEALSSHNGVPSDLVLEYEATRNQLLEDKLRISELESEVESLRKAEAILTFSEHHSEKRESSLKGEVAVLRRRLSDLGEGRHAENEILLSKLKQSEERVKELGARCAELEKQCVELHEQLALQDNESLTESDKDNEIRMATKKMKRADKSDHESMEKVAALEKELTLQKEKNEDIFKESQTLKDSCQSLEQEKRKLSEQFQIEKLKLVDQNRSLESDLESAHEALQESEAHEQSLKDENAELHDELEDLSEHTKSAEEEVESLRREVTKFKSRVQELELELEDAHFEIESTALSTSSITSPDATQHAGDNGGLRHSHEPSGAERPLSASLERPMSSMGEFRARADSRGRARRHIDTQTDTNVDEVLRAASAAQHKQAVQIEELKVELLNLQDVVEDLQDERHVMQISVQDTESLRTENAELKIELDDKDAVIDSHLENMSRLQEQINNFDNTLKDRLAQKDSVIEKMEEQLQECQTNIEELTETIEEISKNDEDKKLQIEELESRILDLNIKLESFRNVISQKDKQLDVVINKRRDAASFKDRNLLMIIEEKKEEIGKLNMKVTSLEKAEQESAKKILELLDIKAQLNNRMRVLETELEDQARSESLEAGKQALEAKVTELQVLLEAEVSKTASLEQELSLVSTNSSNLEERLTAIRATETAATEENGDRNKTVDTAVVSDNRVVELETELEKAREALDSLDEERIRRIVWLQERVSCMEENELRLNETIIELEQADSELREQLAEAEKVSVGASDNDTELRKIKMAEQNLKDRVEQMTLNEQILRENISELQEKLEKYENEDNSGTTQLEAKIKALTEREGELLEEIYQIKLENEELHEHLEELMVSHDEQSSSPEGSPRAAGSAEKPNKHDKENAKLREQMQQIEDENRELKDKLLHAKLESIQTSKDEQFDDLADVHAHIRELEDDRARLKELVFQLETEKGVLIDLNQEMEAQLTHMDAVEQELEAEQTRAAELQSQIQALTAEEAKLNSSISSLEEANEELKDSAKVQDEAKSKEQQELKMKVQQMRSREQGFLKVIEVLKSEKVEKEKAAAEANRETPNSELIELRERVDILLDSQEKLVDKIQQYEEGEEKLKQQLAERDEEIQEVEESLKRQLVAETRQLNDQLHHLEENEEVLHKQLDEYKTMMDRLNAEKIALMKENENLLENNEQLQEDFDQMIDSQKQMQAEASQYQEQARDQEKQLTELETQLQDGVHALQEAQDHVTEKSAALESASAKLVETDKLLKELEEKLAQIEANKADANIKAQEVPLQSSATQELQAEPKEDNVAKGKYEELEKTHKETLEKLEDLEAVYERQQIQAAQMKENLDQAQVRMEELEQTVDEYEEQITGMQKQLSTAHEERDRVEQELLEEAKVVKEKLVETENKIETSTIKITEYEKHVANYEAKIAELEEMLEKQEEKESVEKKESKEKKAQEEVAPDEHEGMLRELRETVARLVEELSLSQNKCAEVEASVTKLKKQNEELELNLAKAIEDKESAEKSLSELNEKNQENEESSGRSLSDLKDKNRDLENALSQIREEKQELENKLSESQRALLEVDGNINKHKDSEKALKTQLNELQAKYDEMLESIEQLEQSVPESPTRMVKETPLIVVSNTTTLASAPKSSPAENTTENTLQSHQPDHSEETKSTKSSQDARESSFSKHDITDLSFTSSTCLDIEVLQGLSPEELVSRVCELQELEQCHRRKIREMGENLSYLRQAVEVVTVSLENDAQIDLSELKPKVKDSAYEERVNQLVKSETSLKLKIVELKNSEASLKRRLTEAEQVRESRDEEFKATRDELETELDNSRKREARYKNQVQYGGPEHETEALTKLQHLEELVFDLESSERRLKRMNKELQERETKLKYQLEELETERELSGVKVISLDDKDKHWELLHTIRTLESSEFELKGKVTQLQREDVDGMQKRITELERSEKVLQMKLDLMESQEPSFLENLDLGALDSPEAVLKQRIVELEKMERHLKEQVVELEKDREELHEIARADKASIHELNVSLREHELAEKNLRDSLNKYDIEESKLYSEVEELKESNEQLTEQVTQLQTKDRHLNAQLQKVQYQETEASLQLANTREDYEVQHSQLRRKLSDADQSKRSLQQKSEELVERVDELEHSELALKQKLRTLEIQDSQNKDRVQELETAEEKANTRLTELEASNELLSERVHALEEEKSQLLYEMSDVQMSKDEQEHERTRLNNQIKLLKERAEDAETKRTELQGQLDEITNKQVHMHHRLQEHEGLDKGHTERISYLEMRELNLNNKIQELEEQLSEARAALHSNEKFEMEHNKLKNQLDYAREENERKEAENEHIRDRIKRLEQGNSATLASVPLSELAKLRETAAKCEDMEQRLTELKERESGLKQDLEAARQGQSCGHETEIKELKSMTEQYKKIVQAHELQKENYEDVKRQLEKLKEKVKGGQVEVKERSSKSVQVKLSEEYTIKNLSTDELLFAMDSNEEFKAALRNLGARHPEAYDDFVKLLQPQERKVSRVRVRARRSHGDEGDDVADVIQPVNVSHTQSAAPGEATVVQMVETSRGERQLWSTVERKRSVGKAEDIVAPQWSAIERNMGDTEEMTLTVNFDPEAGAADQSASEHSDIGGILRKNDHVTKSNDSLLSNGSAPPLPGSNPPPQSQRPLQSPGADSYYLPSADEASELEDDTKVNIRRLQIRAKSEGRDSDFSELASGAAPVTRRGPVAHSLDSIPDDSGYIDTAEVRILRDKVSYLETEVQKRDTQLAEIQDAKVKAEAFVKVKSQLVETERRLETEKREREVKEAELQSVRDKVQQYERNAANLVDKAVTLSLTSADPQASELQGQLERKEKELSAKDNEVDRLTQELRKWQEDYREKDDEHAKLEYMLAKLEKRNEKLKSSSDQFKELLQEHTALKQEHEELEGRYGALHEASREREGLEKQVVDLQFQMADYEALSLNTSDLQARVNTLNAELKSKDATESQLTRDNAQLRHTLDALQRELRGLKQQESEYKLVKEQYDAMEALSRKAQTMVTPLRAKVLVLSQKCKARDELIRRLTEALRVHEQDSAVIRAADTVLQASAQEPIRPISPLTSANIADMQREMKSSSVSYVATLPRARRGHRSSANKDSPRTDQSNTVSPRSDQSTSLSDTDDLLDPNFINHNNNLVKSRLTKSSAPVVNSAVNSQQSSSISLTSDHHTALKTSNQINGARPDISSSSHAAMASLAPVTQLDLKPVLQSNVSNHSNSAISILQNGGTTGSDDSASSPVSSAQLYRAIQDYDPRIYSRSGRQHLELPLQEGAVVKLLGGTDSKGYVEAQCNGQVGLVPMNYLEPVRERRHSAQPGRAVAGEPVVQVHANFSRTEAQPNQAAVSQQSDGDHLGSRGVNKQRSKSLSLAHPAFRRPAMSALSPRSVNSHHARRTAAPNSMYKQGEICVSENREMPIFGSLTDQDSNRDGWLSCWGRGAQPLKGENSKIDIQSEVRMSEEDLEVQRIFGKISPVTNDEKTQGISPDCSHKFQFLNQSDSMFDVCSPFNTNQTTNPLLQLPIHMQSHFQKDVVVPLNVPKNVHSYDDNPLLVDIPDCDYTYNMWGEKYDLPCQGENEPFLSYVDPSGTHWYNNWEPGEMQESGIEMDNDVISSLFDVFKMPQTNEMTDISESELENPDDDDDECVFMCPILAPKQKPDSPHFDTFWAPLPPKWQ